MRVSAIAFAAVLAHLAFDIFLAGAAHDSGTRFPLFSPFYLGTIEFSGLDWIGIQIIGVCVVAIVSYVVKRKGIHIQSNFTKT